MPESYDVTFVTYVDLPDLDQEDRRSLDLLRARGWRCNVAIWSDQSVDWSGAGLVVLRSTWDYHLCPTRFLQWAKQLGSQLVNSYELVRWNSDKSYLLDLQRKGVSIIPTMLVRKSDVFSEIEQSLMTRGWQDIIIKPVVGLATFGVKRFSLPEQADEAREHTESLSNHGDALIQRFIPAVFEQGERALVYIDGNFSHAIRKSPFQILAEAGHAGESTIVVSEAEIAFGHAVLASLSSKQKPLYARIDVVPDADGKPLLMELELIEPSLYLSFDAQAPMRFAVAVERLLQQRSVTPTSFVVRV